MRLATFTDSIHSLEETRQPLGVTCTKEGCGHRATIPLFTVQLMAGKKVLLADLKLRCLVCGARSGFDLYLFQYDSEVTDFVVSDQNRH